MLPLPACDTHASFADHARCRRMLREGSLSFYAASRLLPDRVRSPATIFYAFCRLADDGVDRAADKRASLERLDRRLRDAYDGRPVAQPVDRAFADLVRRYPVPKTVIDLLFEGFSWDCDNRRYETLADVRAYSVRVAATVGVVMALLMGVRHRAAFDRACDLGVAMQLTNIARDIGEDANAGRLYLPTQWLKEEGIDPDAFLAKPVFTPALGRVTERLLSEADMLYQRAEAGIKGLPAACRPAIFAARHIYAAIGGRIAAAGFDSVNTRAFVSRGRKTRLIARACLDSYGLSRAQDVAGVPEARVLTDLAVAAVTDKGLPPSRAERAIWALSLVAGGTARREERG